MKTLVLNGSPAKKGNTAALVAQLCAVLEGEVAVVDCYTVDVAPCTDCRFCYKNPGCSIQDDMQAIYEQVEEADAVVLATPMHFGIVSPPLFTVLSRLQSYWAQAHVRGLAPSGPPKLGALLVACGTRWMNMELLCDGLANLAFSHMNVAETVGRVYAKNTDKTPAAQNEAALMQTRRLAHTLNRRVLGEE